MRQVKAVLFRALVLAKVNLVWHKYRTDPFIQAASVALAKSVTAVALAKGAAASGSTLTLIKGALKLMAWTKVKTAIVVGVGVLLAAGTITLTIKEIQEHRWQVANGNSAEGLKALNTAPPQVTIVRSKFTTDQGHGSLMDDVPPKDQWRYIGIHSTPSEIIKQAYWDGDFLLPSQIILLPDMLDGYYDYIANLTNGSQQVLQALIKKKFGLVGKYEMRDMDVLLLKVDYPNAPGLKSGTPPPPDQPRPLTLITHNTIHYKNLPISKLCIYLKQDFQVPVIDQTGLTGNYDLDFPDVRAFTPSEKIEKIKQALLDEFGLKLVSSREPIKMLVVEKVK